MNKTLKTVLIILIAALLIGAAIGGYFIWRHTSTYIGRDAAIQAAVTDAGLNVAGVYDVSAEFEKSAGSAWYDVDFQTHGTEYEYSVDAVSGAILYSYSEPEHADR